MGSAAAATAARAGLLSLLAFATSICAVTLGSTRSKDPPHVLSDLRSPGVGPLDLPYECQVSHDEYLERPIKDVLFLNPGVDGWCYYSWLGIVFSECASARQKKDYSFYLDKSTNLETNGVNAWRSNGNPWSITFDGTTIQGSDRVHPLYDVLCAANGYYHLPRQLVHDWDRLNEMSKDHCKLLSEKYPEYSNMSMYDYFNEIKSVEETLAPITRFDVADLDIKGLRDRMFKLEAMQCLLGGVGCDMAMCVGRGCRRNGKGNQIVYGPECPIP